MICRPSGHHQFSSISRGRPLNVQCKASSGPFCMRPCDLSGQRMARDFKGVQPRHLGGRVDTVFSSLASSCRYCVENPLNRGCLDGPSSPLAGRLRIADHPVDCWTWYCRYSFQGLLFIHGCRCASAPGGSAPDNSGADRSRSRSQGLRQGSGRGSRHCG